VNVSQAGVASVSIFSSEGQGLAFGFHSSRWMSAWYVGTGLACLFSFSLSRHLLVCNWRFNL